jgi:hypothetical protein
MILYVSIYTFIGLATAFAVIADARDTNDLIASAIVGIIWPLWLVSQILRKVFG